MSLQEEPHELRPDWTSQGGWVMFEARVRARRLAACLDRAQKLIESEQLDGAREAIDEVRTLAPDAPEIAELEQRISTRPKPGVAFLAAEPERIESSREWRQVLAAVTVVVALFSLAGYGVAKFLHGFAFPEFLSTGDVTTPAPDPASDAREATRTPEPVLPPATSVQPSRPALPAVPTEPQEAPAQSSAARPDVRTQPPPPPPVGAIGQVRARPEPLVTNDRQQPTKSPAQSPAQSPTQSPAQPPAAQSGTTALPEVRQLAEARPVEAVALEMTSTTPTATTGAQPMAALDAPVPAPAPESGESRHDESLRIRTVLLRYETAYNRLDAKAARTVWPGVNESALNRAFGGLISQKVSLGLCDITVFGNVAGASCAGKARWEPKVGGGLQTADRYWSFQLTKSADGWQIKEVLVR